MKKLILASLLLLSSQMVMAANWVNVYVSSKKDKETTYIDLDSVQAFYFNNYDKNNYYITAWVKKDYPATKKLVNKKSYNQGQYYWYVDCLNKKYTTDEFIAYSRSGYLVDHVKQYVSKHSSDNWERVVPDTMGEATSKVICTIYDIKINNTPKQS